jgi:hypothetical protein
VTLAALTPDTAGAVVAAGLDTGAAGAAACGGWAQPVSIASIATSVVAKWEGQLAPSGEARPEARAAAA